MIEFVSKKQENGSVIHYLKCVDPYYYDIEWMRKTFEIRKDDREFKFNIGDSLGLFEIKDGRPTGEFITRRVIYVLRDAEQFGLMPGYVILGIK